MECTKVYTVFRFLRAMHFGKRAFEERVKYYYWNQTFQIVV